MNRPVRSKVLIGITMLATLCLTAFMASAQQPMPGAAAPGAGSSDIIRIRKMTPGSEKTPIFKTAVQGQGFARQTDWWHVVVEYETAPEWIDELEFTYYAYMKDQSNKNAPVMFRSSVSYVNIAKGKHYSDMFLHPNILARLGRVEQVAVVVKAKGAVVAIESTAKTPNWWDQFSPVEGVMLNRSQTPFSVVDYDMFEAIKPTTGAR